MNRFPAWLLSSLVGLTLISVLTMPAWAQDGERKIKIDEVPPLVKAAILEAVGSGKLVDIGVLTEGDRSFYEIEMIVDGEERDLCFGEDGKILSRKLEGAEDEDSNQDEADEETGKPADNGREYQSTFNLEGRELSSTGRNRYFILEPNYQLVLEGKDGDETERLVVTVLDETKVIGGIETRIVEERETVNGELAEISRNYFAICKATGTVFYFGEAVDIYKDGKVIRHDGAWVHGEAGARAGIMMPGEPIVGARFMQEVAPKVAIDRAEVINLTTSLKTPAGTFKNCLKTKEENPLDGGKEFKIHAPGIGLIQDEHLLLVKHGFLPR